MERLNSKIIVLTTLYNSQNYITTCIETIKKQNYSDFHCYITDDLSTDNSVSLAEKSINNDKRFTLITNSKKFYQPGNYDQVLRFNPEIDDNDIVIEVDGDDWLPDPNVFNRIFGIYNNPDVWIANGSFKYHNGFPGFSKQQDSFDNLRQSRFTASHIRTWRAFLWRKILVDDLKDDSGNYWKISGDLSFMFPMLEMAGKEHYRFMPEVNYVYNESNPLNDHKVDLRLVTEVANEIRKKPKYSKL